MNIIEDEEGLWWIIDNRGDFGSFEDYYQAADYLEHMKNLLEREEKNDRNY